MAPLRKMASFASRTEFTRYFWAGSLAFAVDFSIFFLLTEVLGVNYLWANFYGICVGIIINYLLCVRWVFSERRYSKVVIEIPLFVLLCVISIVNNELLLWIFVEFAGVYHLYAKILVTLCVFVLNFYMKKIVLFQKLVK